MVTLERLVSSLAAAILGCVIGLFTGLLVGWREPPVKAPVRLSGVSVYDRYRDAAQSN